MLRANGTYVTQASRVGEPPRQGRFSAQTLFLPSRLACDSESICKMPLPQVACFRSTYPRVLGRREGSKPTLRGIHHRLASVSKGPYINAIAVHGSLNLVAAPPSGCARSLMQFSITSETPARTCDWLARATFQELIPLRCTLIRQ